MNVKTLTQYLLGFALSLASVQLFADVVETKNGARLVGKISKIDGTLVWLDTAYAGEVKIKQSEVATITTETPLNVRLSSGTVVQGTISGAGAGTVAIAGTDTTLPTTVDKIAETWGPGQQDPEILALQRKWAYEMAVDVAGKTGNKDQLATAFNARATLKTPTDALMFYAGYDREISEGTKSADQGKAGLDYQNNFSGKYSWYVRDEGGFDRVKDIELYNTAALGLGYDFIKKPKHTLTGRTGLSFRYEGYKNPVTKDIKAAGLDFGLNHEYDTPYWSLINRLSYVPLLEDFNNFRVQHESYFQFPLANPAWKLRLGVTNDYNSKPSAGLEKLDTTYFSRFVMYWK
jgi:hypothetical protein